MLTTHKKAAARHCRRAAGARSARRRSGAEAGAWRKARGSCPARDPAPPPDEADARPRPRQGTPAAGAADAEAAHAGIAPGSRPHVDGLGSARAGLWTGLMLASPRQPFSVPLPRPALRSSSALARSSWACSTSRPTRSPTAASPSNPRRALDRALRDRGGGRGPRRHRRRVDAPGRRRRSMPSEEWRRLRPVLKGLALAFAIPLSIDTYRAETARRALDDGAAIVNDISGLEYDAAPGRVVAARRRRAGADAHARPVARHVSARRATTMSSRRRAASCSGASSGPSAAA